MKKIASVRKKKSTPARDKAQAFLTTRLSERHPVMEQEKIIKLAKEQGITESTLRRAKKALGVDAVKGVSRDGAWFWKRHGHPYKKEDYVAHCDEDDTLTEEKIREAEKNKIHDFYFK
jgi:hypothetical protein